MAKRVVPLSTDERATLAHIADGTLHVDCLTRPRAVAALLDLGRAKAARKGVDYLVVNRVGWNEGFATDRNAVIVLSGDGAIVGEADSSKVVLSEVRDTVLAMMPSLMRLFFGSDSPVNYTPLAPNYEKRAQQATGAAITIHPGRDRAPPVGRVRDARPRAVLDAGVKP